MPATSDITKNKVLGREYKRGESAILRREIEARFGAIPQSAEERLAATSMEDLLQ